MSTPDRIAAALTAASAPKAMIVAARAGCYDDFLSESATPISDLVRDCVANGLHDVARRARDGEFDATREEAEAWLEETDAWLTSTKWGKREKIQ